MDDEQDPLTASQAIAAIPAEVRPAVVAWLEAMARLADSTVSRLTAEVRRGKSPTLLAMIDYWSHVGAGHRLAAARMSMSGQRPRRAKKRGQNERG